MSHQLTIEFAQIWTADTLPGDFDHVEDPVVRTLAAAVATAVCWAERPQDGGDASDAEAAGIAAGLRAVEERLGKRPPDPGPESRPPTPGAQTDPAEQFTASEAVCGATVELRHGNGETITFRGVPRIVSRDQMLVIARTEHQAGRAVKVTAEALTQAAANATRWPLIPIDFDHQSGRGGHAGGVVLPESVRVGTDPKSGNPALFGDVAYNLGTAAEVKDGKWLGGSVRLVRIPDKRTGKPMGAVLGAWSLTNTPQQEDIIVNTEFTMSTALDTTNSLRQSDTNSTATPMGEEQMADDIKLQELTSANDLLETKVAELTAANDKLSGQAAEVATERDTLQNKVTELTAGKSTAEQEAIALATKVNETSTQVAELTQSLADADAEREVEQLCNLHFISAADKPLALMLRKQGADAPAWVQFKSTHGEAIRQAEMSGVTAEPEKAGAGGLGWAELTVKAMADKGLPDEHAVTEFLLSAAGEAAYPGANAAYTEFATN